MTTEYILLESGSALLLEIGDHFLLETASITDAPPTVLVEAGFGFGALTDPASITWVDISTRVLAMNIHRGRSSELDQFSPGSLTMTLDNHDRLFDPEYTAGTYYGNLVANVPIRVTDTAGVNSYPRFYGFVNGWPQSYAPPKDATVQVTATDGFKVLSWLRLPESVWASIVAGWDPKIWWRLGDTGEVAVDSSGNGYDGRYNEPLTTGSALIAGDSRPSSVFVNSGVPQVSTADSNAITDPADIFISVVVRFDEAGGGVVQQLVAQASAALGWELHWGSHVGPVLNTNSPSARTIAVSGTISFTGPTLVWIFYGKNTIGSFEALFMNGQPMSILTGAGPGVPASPAALMVGGTPSTWAESNDGSFQFAVCDVVIGNPATSVQNPALAPQSMAEAWRALIAPWVDDSTGTRLGRILDLVGWPAGQRTIDTGETLLGPAVLAGRAPLDYAQQLEQTEQGRLFMGPDGKVVFHARNHDLTTATSNTSQATFTDTGSGIEYEPDFQLTRDDRFLFRQVTATREGGASITVRDSTLAATDEVQTRDLSGLLVRTDAEAQNIAESFLLRYKTSKTRPSQWTVKPLDSTTHWQTVLALDIGYRVTVEAEPQTIGARYSADFLIESIDEDWPSGPTDAGTLTFTGSPVDSTSYFLWDSSLLDSTDVWR